MGTREIILLLITFLPGLIIVLDETKWERKSKD